MAALKTGILGHLEEHAQPAAKQKGQNRKPCPSPRARILYSSLTARRASRDAHRTCALAPTRPGSRQNTRPASKRRTFRTCTEAAGGCLHAPTRRGMTREGSPQRFFAELPSVRMPLCRPRYRTAQNDRIFIRLRGSTKGWHRMPPIFFTISKWFYSRRRLCRKINR